MALAVLIILVYAPSFYHVARCDQVNYIAEMSSRHGFVDTVLGTFDLNRTRDFAPGDELAFRPLLYVILGLQKYFFGYGMFWWQVFSIAAHLFAVGALYALLCRAKGTAFALAGAAFFAFLPVNIEAVVWSHISPYVVFAGCVLMALKELYAFDSHDGAGSRHIIRALGWLVPVVFLYETGVWYALAIGGFLWLRGHRRGAWGSWGIAALSLVFNAADLVFRGIKVAAASGQIEWGQAVLSTLLNTLLLFKWFFVSALFLDGHDLMIKVRMMIRPEALAWLWPLGAPLTGAIAAGTVLLAVGFWRLFSMKDIDRRADLSVLCLVMAAGYGLVIVLGRINGLGMVGIGRAPYYVYNFLILILAFMAFMPMEGAGGRVVKWIVFMVLGAAVCINIMTVSTVTRDMAGAASTQRALMITLERFVRVHAVEPDFSFFMPPGKDANYILPDLIRRGGTPGHVYTLAEALYPQYFDKVRPKYVIYDDQ